MLHRFLFVAGMTAGVMAPLVWAAYVARPAAQATHDAYAPAEQIAKAVPRKAAPDAKKPPQTPAEDVIASIPPAVPPSRKATALTPPKQDPSLPVIKRPDAAAAAKSLRSRLITQVVERRANDRTLPAVVDSYNGAHIITVCAALTENEQLRAGCP